METTVHALMSSIRSKYYASGRRIEIISPRGQKTIDVVAIPTSTARWMSLGTPIKHCLLGTVVNNTTPSTEEHHGRILLWFTQFK